MKPEDVFHILGSNDKGFGRERFTSEQASQKPLKESDIASLFPGQRLSTSESVIYFTAAMCHSISMKNPIGTRNARGRAFTAKTLANSHATASDNLVDIDHLLVANENSMSDHICGHIKSTSFGSGLINSSDAASALFDEDASIPMYALCALYLRHAKIPGIIENYLSGKESWSVSMECGHRWDQSALLYENEIIPVVDAEEGLLRCIKKDGMLQYKGKDVTLLLGGENGSVNFWGLGLTMFPADPNANIYTLFAGTPFEVACEGSKHSMPIKVASLGHGMAGKNKHDVYAEVASKVINPFVNDLAAITVIGITDPAEDGHVHEILSNGLTKQVNGHYHRASDYSLTTGTKPSFSGVTDHHYHPVRNEAGDYIGENSHFHTFDISLKTSSKKSNGDSDPADPELANEAGMLDSSILESEIESQVLLTGDCEMDELLKLLQRAKNGASGDAASVSILNEIEKKISDIASEKEIASKISSAIASQVDAGELISKEDHEKALAEAEARVRKELEDKAAEEQRIAGIKQSRLEQVTAIGVNPQYAIDGEKTVAQFLDDISFDDSGDRAFSVFTASLRALAASQQQQQAQEQQAEAANKNKPTEKPADKPVPLLLVGSGSPSGSESASGGSALDTPNSRQKNIVKGGASCLTSV